MKCVMCGRALKSKASIARGMGPSCAKKGKKEEQFEIDEAAFVTAQQIEESFVDELDAISEKVS